MKQQGWSFHTTIKCYAAIAGYQRNPLSFSLSYQHTIKRVAMNLLQLCIFSAMLRLNRQKIETLR